MNNWPFTHSKLNDQAFPNQERLPIAFLSALSVNEPLQIFEIGNLARNGEDALLVEAIDVLCFFQQMEEQRVVEIKYGDHKPRLLFLGVPNVHCHEALWYVFGRIPILLFVVLHKTYTARRKMAANMPFSASQKVRTTARGLKAVTCVQTMNRRRRDSRERSLTARSIGPLSLIILSTMRSRALGLQNCFPELYNLAFQFQTLGIYIHVHGYTFVVSRQKEI